MRQKLIRTIETCAFSGRHGASKVVSVPIDNDCGEQIEARQTVVLSLGGSITDFALTPDAQSVFQGMMRLAFVQAVTDCRSYRWIARDLGINKNTVLEIMKRHRENAL